jgi:hypothetical protein
MASHRLIEEHLAVLADRLPADAVAELTDGLVETWRHQLATGSPPDTAARAAIAEFGDPDRITRAFVAQAPGRRTALALLATGPLVGMCWGASLVAARVWTWPIPTVGVAVFALALLAVAATLAAAATSRRSYRRTRLGTAGGAGLVVLDALMLVAVITVAPVLVWPMAVAIPASLARIGLTVRCGLHRALRVWY